MESAIILKKNANIPFYIRSMKSKSYKIGFMLIYIAMILIPSYHAFTAKIPPDNKLKITNGELFIGPNISSGNMTGLKTPQGRILFTCGDTLTNSNVCLVRKDSDKIKGKQVSVTWFQQNAYLGYQRNRLVELVYGREKIISREETEKMMSIRNSGALEFAIFGLLIMLGIGIAFYKLSIMRYEKEKKGNCFN